MMPTRDERGRFIGGNGGPSRIKLTCSVCGHKWRTKLDPELSPCPRCGPAPAPKPKPSVIPAVMAPAPPTPKSSTSRRDDNRYTQLAINEFVHYIGCWSDPNISRAKYLRDEGLHDKQEYQKALINLIEVNKTRHDEVGRLETQAAKMELLTMGVMK